MKDSKNNPHAKNLLLKTWCLGHSARLQIAILLLYIFSQCHSISVLFNFCMTSTSLLFTVFLL